MKKKIQEDHAWEPIKESKGFWGYHMYKCKNCKKETHIGLEPECYEGPCYPSDVDNLRQK